MFNSTVLEVAIGLIFCYASVALIASSIYEAIASGLSLRSKTLLNGIASLLNAPKDGTGNILLLDIYNNAIAHPTGNGLATSVKDIKNKPSYIPSKDFALALIQSIQSVPGDFAGLSKDIALIQDQQLKKMLLSFHGRAASTAEEFQTEIANWFDAGMGRVSGAYKKKSQMWCFIIALLLAIIFNIDSVHLFQALWAQPTLVAQLNVATASAANANQSLATLQSIATMQTLPIGWKTTFTFSVLLQPCIVFEWFKDTVLQPSLIVGWLITASATLFGAPFWFDALKTLVRIRGTGTKPEHK